MFYQIAKEGPPTKYELSRLRSFEVTGRMNNFLMQFFDFGTDLAFMLVLFDQAGAISLPGYWDLYKSTVGDHCPGDPAFFGEHKDIVLNIAIASAFFITISTLFRAATSAVQIYKGRKDLVGIGEMLFVASGFFVSIVDPWNGALFINEVMVSTRLDKTDYDLARTELIADVMLVLLEDLPQLIIQIIYGYYAGEFERTTVAWFIAVFATGIHLTTQVQEIIHLYTQLPWLKTLQASQQTIE